MVLSSAGSQAIAEVCFHMIADDRRTFCDLRSAIVCDHMETSIWNTNLAYLQAILSPRGHRKPQNSRTKIHLSNGYTLFSRNQRNASHSTNYSQIHATIFPSSSSLPRKPTTLHNSSICSDEGLTLEMSAF